ncbi:hypothetical protein UFOVP163_35 [uncultured Caudovirales phage]|uniref:Uncharacterized protein n=1 Tax=uncultured Caudovirales phage TaxID=2100421 RepID=A0A6J7WB25_9CAUD|nr:hypothetical protein UFOVP163_35 [uncultured Caudovirales phage]
MAFIDNTTYYGKDVEGFYSKLLLEFKSAKYFSPIVNAKDKVKIATLTRGNVLQAGDCDFTSAGEGALAQKTIVPADVKINIEYCVKTFEQNYLGEKLRPGSMTGEVIPTASGVQNYFLNLALSASQNDLERMTWAGDTGTASYPLSLVNGILKQLESDGTAIKLSATASVDETTVISELFRVYKAIPDAVKQRGNAVMFISQDIADFYFQAVAIKGNYNNMFADGKSLNFFGVELIIAPGIGTKKIVAGEKSNFIMVTDLMSDLEDIQILNLYGVTGQPVARFVARFKFAVSYAIGAEIVYLR